MRLVRVLALAAALGSTACGRREPEPTPAYEFLSPTGHLVRASVAVRGLRPTLDELDRVEADPDAIRGLLHEWLRSPEFALTVRDLHAELYWTRTDIEDQLPSMGLLEGVPTKDVYAASSEEALRLVEHVVVNDLPYSEIVTADYTLANAVLATMYPIAYDPGGPEWQVTHYVDGRPHAGILTGTEIYRRHLSNGSNFQRGRANFWAGTLLCEAFGDRDVLVEGGIDVADDAAVAEAVRTQASCVGCHQALDPIAVTLFGFQRNLFDFSVEGAHEFGCTEEIENAENNAELFWRFGKDFCYPARFYATENEHLWEELGLPPPAYYGRPVESVVDVGRLMAEDPRFAQCSARQLYRVLGQIPLSDVGPEQSARLQALFVAEGMNVRDYVEAVVLSDPFRAVARLRPDVDDAIPVQVVRPEAYTRIVEDLTGFRWRAVPDRANCYPRCWGEVDLGDSDAYGFRTLAGGIDGMQVTVPSHTVTPTKLLVLQRFAEEAASYVVASDLALPAAERRLLRAVEASTTDEAQVRAQTVELTRRILSRRVAEDSEEIDELWSLWTGGNATGGPTTAWTLVIALLLQDPGIVYY